ncbi:MAG: hypothetical protein JW864_06345 [Spirochaetes bacterium]|nr:hypothetical protein [Spirochaetota bacterium]
MKLKTAVIILYLLSAVSLYAREFENILLNDIISNAEQYNNKNIKLKLRLKNIDKIFNKITFYDRKNIDIVFDISELKKTAQFKERAANMREGLEYIVEFTVKDIIEDTGFISGELIDFQPEIIFRLPEIQKNQKAE